MDMKQGACLGWAAVLAAVLCGPSLIRAQNLGLGTGSRSGADTAQEIRNGTAEDGSSPRRNQMNKRLGLTARRSGVFDPKVFEARGRDLQGQFYEIGTPVDAAGREAPAQRPLGETGDGTLQRKARKQWMFWAGMAGVAGASAGAVGYFLMSNAHPTAPPPKIVIVKD